MPKYINYAIDKRALQSFIEHRQNISSAAAKLTEKRINEIKLQVEEFKTDGRLTHTIIDGVSHIPIVGLLQPKPDICSILFEEDMTVYSDIIEAIKAGEEDDNVTEHVLDIDSPGGNVVGVEATCNHIRNTTKPITAIVHGMACSGAYWLASQADKIIVTGETNEVGSIGVITERTDYSEADKQAGVKSYILTSENAPNKHFDAATERGRLQIIERLTKFEEIFIGYVAAGRNTTTEDVAANFGRGAILIARDALNAGMIDKIESELPKAGKKKPAKAIIKPAAQNATDDNQNNTGENHMEMTEEQISAMVNKAANTAATTAVAGAEANFQAQLQARDTETARVAAFQPLFAKFPNQKDLINTEIKKEGAQATADFTIKLMDTETARAAAETEQQTNATDKPDGVKPGDDKPEKGESVQALADQFGEDN
ncbi:S49 family peptidase [Candidatus Pacearchaeota archaeon]|nr:S49 family peptidase [Candidatus Pacearchaeota archaeon]